MGGPWFTPQQLQLHKAFYGDTPKEGCFNPRLFQSTLTETFHKDVKSLEESDEMHAFVYGDIGTAWEIGYAYAIQKPVYILVEDMQSAVSQKMNLMISESVNGVVTLADYNQGNFDRDLAKQNLDKIWNTWEEVE